MNSMFSLFDAFTAELLLGKTVRASSSVPSFAPKKGSSGSVKSQPADGGVNAAANQEQAKSSKNSMRLQPRFAPELDGLNCFETLVPY